MDNKLRNQQRKAGLLSSKNATAASFNFNDKESRFGMESTVRENNRKFESQWDSNISAENNHFGGNVKNN